MNILYLIPSSIKVLKERKSFDKLSNRRVLGMFDNAVTINPIVRSNEAYDHVMVSESNPHIVVADVKRTFYGQLSLYADTHHRKLYHLVRAGDPFAHGLWANRIAKWQDCPYVVYIAANFDMAYDRAKEKPTPLPWFLNKLLARYVLSRADGVIAGNIDNELWALKNGARVGKTTTIRNIGIHSLFYEEPKRTVDSLTNCLYVSRLVKSYKPFIEDCITATSAAQVKLTIAGEGPCKEELQRYAADSPNVKFLGNVTQEKLRELYCSHTIFLSPFGGSTLVEAALSGCYIIAYDLEWKPEFMVDNWNGALVKPSTNGLFTAIREVTQRMPLKQVVKQMHQARKDALETFDVRKLLKQEKKFYERVLEDFQSRKK